jgi:NTE family protein
MSKALVLGGGGVTGIAWEVGLLLGLRRAGVDLGTADAIIGTSAGSVVGTLVATGTDLEAMAAAQRDAGADEAPIKADMQRVMQTFSVLFDASVAPGEARARVGAMALAAPVGDEESYLQRFARQIPKTPWPTSPRLVITGVDAQSGKPVAWDAASHVPLVRAVAASCAVPSVFPPVTIEGRRYMDGGVRSHINAYLAAGASRVVVVAPIAAFAPRWPQERAALGDAAVVLVGPDEPSFDAIGPDVMDTSRRREALEAGIAQGAAVAGAVRAVWG